MDTTHAQTPHQGGGVLTYVVIFACLILLTGLTAGAAEIDLGALNTPIAVGIAITKALLVLAYFMHLRSSGQLTRIAVACAVAWLVLLVLGTMDDVLTRDTKSYLRNVRAGVSGTAADTAAPGSHGR